MPAASRPVRRPAIKICLLVFFSAVYFSLRVNVSLHYSSLVLDVCVL